MSKWYFGYSSEMVESNVVVPLPMVVLQASNGMYNRIILNIELLLHIIVVFFHIPP